MHIKLAIILLLPVDFFKPRSTDTFFNHSHIYPTCTVIIASFITSYPDDINLFFFLTYFTLIPLTFLIVLLFLIDSKHTKCSNSFRNPSFIPVGNSAKTGVLLLIISFYFKCISILILTTILLQAQDSPDILFSFSVEEFISEEEISSSSILAPQYSSSVPADLRNTSNP